MNGLKNKTMSDFPIEYDKARTKDFWCEQDAKWHPKCECKDQCWDCALVQGSKKKPKQK